MTMSNKLLSKIVSGVCFTKFNYYTILEGTLFVCMSTEKKGSKLLVLVGKACKNLAWKNVITTSLILKPFCPVNNNPRSDRCLQYRKWECKTNFSYIQGMWFEVITLVCNKFHHLTCNEIKQLLQFIALHTSKLPPKLSSTNKRVFMLCILLNEILKQQCIWKPGDAIVAAAILTLFA